MKRIHLFEFEDFSWFPHWLRQCMTRLIIVMHKLLGTEEKLAELLNRAIKHSSKPAIIDLCSGSGGPMIGAYSLLKDKYKISNLTLKLTDLYPDLSLAKRINSDQNPAIIYSETPVDATNIDLDTTGVRTMVCSMHHMKPEVAYNILKNAKDSMQPICIFEISDNRYPLFLSLLAFPLNIITALLITPFARPFTIQQFVFTYLIPIIPIFFAWDGAVSNVRTYTLDDMDILLKDLQADNYKWEKGILKGKSNMLYLMGLPETTRT